MPITADEAASLLTVKQAADKLRMGVSTLRKYTAEKKVASVRLGSRVYYRPDDLDAFYRARVAEGREGVEGAPRLDTVTPRRRSKARQLHTNSDAGPFIDAVPAEGAA